MWKKLLDWVLKTFTKAAEVEIDKKVHDHFDDSE